MGPDPRSSVLSCTYIIGDDWEDVSPLQKGE